MKRILIGILLCTTVAFAGCSDNRTVRAKVKAGKY